MKDHSLGLRPEPAPPYTPDRVAEWIQYQLRITGHPPAPEHVARQRAEEWIRDRRRMYRIRARMAARLTEKVPEQLETPRETKERLYPELKRLKYRQLKDLAQFFLNQQELTPDQEQIVEVLKELLGADWARPFNAPPAATVVYGGLPGLGHRHS